MTNCAGITDPGGMTLKRPPVLSGGLFFWYTASMTTEQLSKEIYSRYGAVRRARGIYLYTEKGVRLTDCYLDGGRAIMGYGTGKARTQFKDTFERGANGVYASGFESRLITAVRHLLPECYSVIRWWNDETIAGAQMLSGGESDAVLWRPFLDFAAVPEKNIAGYPVASVTWPSAETPDQLPDVIQLIPPFSWAGIPHLYAFKSVSETSVPPSDTIAAPLLVAMARAFSDLKSFLATYTDDDFARNTRALSPWFTRKSIWLFYTGAVSDYDSLVLTALEAGIILPPDPVTPAIVPFRANPGDLKKLAGAAASCGAGASQ